MTKQHQIWFEKLAKDREDSAKTLEKPSMRGIKNSVVEKYSDQAHFIYELLQNANDAKATKSSFQLTSDGLYFRHNGEILFSVSNPDTEDKDKENDTLGHINSITAIANSNKTESSIGKFGVGFKAVFQYTETPHIYDPNFQFKIDRFIIPVKLESDLSDRQTDETVFYFPFNKAEMSAEKAHSDILEKLKKLVFPTLFLSNLQEVKWNAESETGEYTKNSISQEQAIDITYEKIELFQQIGLNRTTEKLYLFSRSTEKNYSYSIGFFLDEKDKLTPKQFPAFCFFPTKESTNLNFILHAPFLLTDSREGIHRSKEHNTEIVEVLSQLAADSLLILKELKLIDNDIINIIPYKESTFNNSLFKPFFSAIKSKFQTNNILPTNQNGETVSKENAYWFQDKPIIELFSNEQLQILSNNANAKWVFTELARNQTTGETEGIYPKTYPKQQFIDSCVKEHFEMEKLLQKITADFIKQQPKEWLHKLYEYLSKTLKTYENVVKNKPIFLDADDNAVPAFDVNKQLVLFLPSINENTSFKAINKDLLQNEKSKDFFTVFGIKQPSLKDEIYNKILPLYNTDEGIDTRPHFEIFFKYWKEEGRPEDFINLIKDKSFILYKTNDNEKRFRGVANTIYYPTDDLQKYFETKLDTKFVDIEDYYTFITDEKEQQILKEFLLKLGVSVLPRIFEREITDSSIKESLNLNQSTRGYDDRNTTTDKILDGCKEILNNINEKKSKLLWNILFDLGKKHNNNNYDNLKTKLTGKHRYFYYSQQYQYFESTTLTLLKRSEWLLSQNGKFVAPHEITIGELAEDYERNAELERLLGFKPTVILTETERIAKKFENEEEAELAKRLLDEYKTRQYPTTANNGNNRNSNNTGSDLGDESFEQPKISKIEKTIKDLDDLQNEFTPKQKDDKNERQETQSKPEINFDEDEEFAKGIEVLKKQLEIKKSRVDLAENINNSVKYSYDWFRTYLQLLTTYGEKQDTQTQKSISFQEIKPYKDDNKYFLLCGASSYISPEIENANDFKVSLVFGNGKRENITVEGVSKKGQDLLIYCREPLSSNTLSRLSNIFKVEINFTPVIDLLDRLYKAFTNDNYIKTWQDIQKSMPSLNFIYGPPGTGKTTTLCNNINDILAGNPNAKFLVLTPTNKAADVVCKKLLVENPIINAVRLSSPTDPELEEYQVYRDILHNDDIGDINVVASTIHRLPYFEIQEKGFLFQYQWDYVIFDEASMTGLHYITFAIMTLFKTNPNTNFIVAGDPKQIPPVIEIDEKELENFDFQDENIYKMMNLESFNPKEQTIRENDTIQNLDTQYRSIPQIGQLFSELSYSSLLKHDRTTNRQESKPLPEEFKNLISSNVTFVDIPLDKDNSIYKVNKLFYSSYHIYSAILVSEIIKYFDSINNEQWTIGLIAPYKAQAILLNKLITSYGISENIKVFSDTVHGFQGDECDIVFFVCNPNNYFYSGHEKALLSKEYIYNVAISRAKDYLIVLHPYTAISNPFIETIGKSNNENFDRTKTLKAKNIEEKLFDDENYIENNSYVSGHDNVNVFGLSDMKYFIKAGDTAIDIQLRALKEYKTNVLNDTNDSQGKEIAKQNVGLKIVGKIDLSKFEKYKKKK